MQPYPYVTYPYATGATVPINYMAPINYQQSSPLYVNQSYNPYGTIPVSYVSQQGPYPFPPISNRMPMMFQPQQQQQQQQQPYIQQFQHPQVYFNNPNRFNGVKPAVPISKKTVKNASKKNLTESKNNPPGGNKTRPAKGLTLNNDLLKNKGAKVRVSKVNRTSKRNTGFQDDSSDDEFERIPLDSPRSETFKQRPVAQTRRISTTSSSCSHCSTCTNCSCLECRQKNGRHMYDDCSLCRAEREQGQTKRQKPK